jgi:aspartate ammonia-lyase
VFELVLERGLLTREQLDEILNPAAMTAPRTTQEFSTVTVPSV